MKDILNVEVLCFFFFLADKDEDEESQDDSGETQETDAVVSTHTHKLVR